VDGSTQVLEALPQAACNELNVFISAANELADTHEHAETELRAHLRRSATLPVACPSPATPFRVHAAVLWVSEAESGSEAARAVCPFGERAAVTSLAAAHVDFEYRRQVRDQGGCPRGWHFANKGRTRARAQGALSLMQRHLPSGDSLHTMASKRFISFQPPLMKYAQRTLRTIVSPQPLSDV
jgi:hypothetical protein